MSFLSFKETFSIASKELCNFLETTFLLDNIRPYLERISEEKNKTRMNLFS